VLDRVNEQIEQIGQASQYFACGSSNSSRPLPKRELVYDILPFRSTLVGLETGTDQKDGWQFGKLVVFMIYADKLTQQMERPETSLQLSNLGDLTRLPYAPS
jgi:hypothetical protein